MKTVQLLMREDTMFSTLLWKSEVRLAATMAPKDPHMELIVSYLEGKGRDISQ